MTEDTKDLLRRADRISGEITLNGNSLTIIPDMAAKIRALEAECAQWQEASGQANVRAEQAEDRAKAAEASRDKLKEECCILAAQVNLSGYVPGSQLDHLNFAKKQTAQLVATEADRDAWRAKAEGMREALFPNAHLDAADNLDGALTDLRMDDVSRGSAEFRVCIETLSRVYVQLGKARAALAAQPEGEKSEPPHVCDEPEWVDASHGNSPVVSGQICIACARKGGPVPIREAQPAPQEPKCPVCGKRMQRITRWENHKADPIVTRRCPRGCQPDSGEDG